MSRTLSMMLGAREPDFSRRIRDWEDRTGRPGHDVRLMSDIARQVRSAVQESGLDQVDTTPKELYYALLERAREDDRVLSAHIGISGDDAPETVISKIVKWLGTKDVEKDLWTIKTSTVKTILKMQTPKRLMKLLGLRSVDSMLKRNDPSDLIALASIVEKPEWLDKLRSEYSRLKPKDFDVVKANIHILDNSQTTKLKNGGVRTSKIISPCYETGVIVVIPSEKRFSCDVLTITTSLLETLADMRRYSAYFRVLSTQIDFGKKLAEVCKRGLSQASIAHGQFHWNPIHKHLLGNEEYMREIEQPHFSRDDLRLDHGIIVLEKVDDRFSFWGGKDHVLFARDFSRPLSMHLADVSINASNLSDFEHAQVMYGQSRLWDELWGRYLDEAGIQQEVIGTFFA